ncbi:MAG TPA: GNAT family N-acetyltransferase [Candidatus Angelobacter sp.]
MMRVSVNLAGPADDAAIRLLMRRQPMPGRVTVTFEREPNFSLGCAVTGEDCRILVARSEDNEIVGVACASVRNVFVNGREQRLGYLGQLRVDERFRGRWLVSRGFSLLRQLHHDTGVPAYLTAIVGGNDEARAVLVEKRRKSFPEFHPVADYCTLAIDLGRPRSAMPCAATICSAAAGDLADIARFLCSCGSKRQFFPVWDESTLHQLSAYGLTAQDLIVARRGGQIVGIVGLWDQSAYKQTVIQAYSGWLRAVAPLWNSAASLLRRNSLPRPGEAVRSAYAALVCVAGNNTAVFASLLREVYRRARSRGFSYLMLGLDALDPFLSLARSYPHIPYTSRLYLAEWSDGGHLHERLEHFPAYVDIATL